MLFRDDNDCLKFLGLLQRYLVEPKYPTKVRHKLYYEDIDLLCFCLMDNHIHLLLQQIEDGKKLAEIMHGLIISYTRYYNEKYPNNGPLFHGVYRARLIQNEQDLIGVSRYIHLNPSPKNPKEALIYPYSSVRCYTDPKNKSFDFVKTKAILDYFHNSPKEYKKFLLA